MWQTFSGKTVWNDARTDETVELILDQIPGRDRNFYKETTGLPISSYFSAVKVKWLRDNVAAVRTALDDRSCFVGTIDSWIVWNLTGGPGAGLHITDVTNASRTLLMNLDTLNWEPKLLLLFGIPIEVLPSIHSSSEKYGAMNCGSVLDGVPISSVSMIRQNCIQQYNRNIFADNGQPAIVDGRANVLPEGSGEELVQECVLLDVQHG